MTHLNQLQTYEGVWGYVHVYGVGGLGGAQGGLMNSTLGQAGFSILATACPSLKRSFILRNSYGFAKEANSDKICTGDVFILELHQKRMGFLLDLFSQSHTMTGIMTHITRLHYDFMIFSRSWRSGALKVMAFLVFRLSLGDSEDTESVNRRSPARSSGEGFGNG